MGATQTVIGGHRRWRFMEGVNDDGYTPEELDFLRAMDEYKRLHRRPFPTWAEVLAVARARGWRKSGRARAAARRHRRPLRPPPEMRQSPTRSASKGLSDIHLTFC